MTVLGNYFGLKAFALLSGIAIAINTTLSALACDVARLGLGSPAILVIGDVVRAAAVLHEGNAAAEARHDDTSAGLRSAQAAVL